MSNISPPLAQAPDSVGADEHSQFEQGAAAFRRGDCVAAARLLLPVAGRGVCYRRAASRYLARMYASGLGGPAKDNVYREVLAFSVEGIAGTTGAGPSAGAGLAP